ncbi:molybdopterin dinucleotide binding domain-containing protein [Rhodoplanes roseus]|uniref:Tetrathionate reductase subunit A n=1 Tax=Rhodoplanes roseus TaxID=29409 RepID=A0A327KYN9_9BRAD|nr:molybdopterin dinucleotide binding domain-containing protein [Rhodoplanes roseus]RAI43206.1 tetrathionate reductase subunit A [Rhodoplanes roseus]
MDRRTVLKSGVALGGLATFAAGYSDTARKVVEGAVESLGPKAARAANINGASLAPEFSVDPATGALTPNPSQRVGYTMCMGCTTYCGVRVRVDTATNRVVRVAGNPFHPLSTDPALPPETSIRDSFVALSRRDEQGLCERSTACGRGAALLAQMTSPFRITTPLKRVGPRGGAQWQPISFEQLLAEVIEGGDLFGEGHVAGLRAIRGTAPIDPARPDLGPKANQLAFLSSTNEGRENFARRFVQQAFGSINFVGHGGYCGGSYRSGSGAAFGDVKQMPHAKPDLAAAEFVIFCGTSPANAGNPFKRQAWQLARGRTDGTLNYVVVDPVLGHSDALAAHHRGRWIPIRPATDGAFAMAMIRWIIENRRYDEKFLTQPNARTAAAAGEASWSNATHLVIAEPGHPREGFFLRASDLGVAIEGDRYSDKDPFVVAEPGTGRLLPHDRLAGAAELIVDAPFAVGEKALRLRSSFDLLRESANRFTIADYATTCGIPADVIEGLAKEFTSHGKKAAVNTHGGTMAGNGFYNAFALVTLNTLIGNLNAKGGTMASGGAFPAEGAGPRYNLATFEGAVTPKGTPLSRNVPYERSGEFKAKTEAGRPYPAEQPWFPAAPQLGTEWFPAALSGYPYPLKALILWNTNPIYGIPGLRAQVDAALKDPKRLPLIIAIDPFINETVAYADYVVPDSLVYESWGFAAPWHGVPTRVSTARWPVVEPPLARTKDGDRIGLESFFIAIAKALGLRGFGANAMTDAGGNAVALDRATDWYMRAAANVAFAGQKPVADASDDDLALTGVDRFVPELRSTLKDDEWRKAAHVLSRGGRFQPVNQAYQGDQMAQKFPRGLQLYNEQVGTARSAVTGRRFAGVPQWTEPAFADGSAMRTHFPASDWPMLLCSQKSVLMNSYAIGLDRLRGIHVENPVAIHADDAAALGLRNGDTVRISTPGGSVVATALVRHGVMKGVIAIEHGYGHKELGARPHVIGGVSQPVKPALAAGVSLNDLGLGDPSRKGPAVWLDPVAGSAVRQGLPARIARV